MKIHGIRGNIRQHSLIKTLFEIKGNPRVLTFLEPLWGIPFNLIAPFSVLYMNAFGVDDIQIGILIAISMGFQVFCAVFAGVIADKFGRKFTAVFGDFLGWVLPCLVWAFAQNIWFFLIAMCLNKSFEQINQTAWNCLLTEDAPKNEIVNIYTWVTIAGLLAVFFAPLSGIFILRDRSVVPFIRVIYFLFAVFMLIKCLITYRFTTETKIGMIRKKETRKTSVFYMVGEYKKLIPMIFQSQIMRSTLIITVILCITGTIGDNFRSLYLKENLQIEEYILSYFPIIRAILMLLFMFTIQSRVEKIRMQIPMSFGFIFSITGLAVLLFCPAGNIGWIVVSTILEAAAVALVLPRQFSMLMLYVDEKERARLTSVMGMIAVTISLPFASVLGVFSSIDRRTLFVFSIALYLAAIVIILRFKEPNESDI